MGEFSAIHWLIVAAVVMLLFGGRRIPEAMRGLGEGIKSFREGIHSGSEKPSSAEVTQSTGEHAKPQPAALSPDDEATS